MTQREVIQLAIEKLVGYGLCEDPTVQEDGVSQYNTTDFKLKWHDRYWHPDKYMNRADINLSSTMVKVKVYAQCDGLPADMYDTDGGIWVEFELNEVGK